MTKFNFEYNEYVQGFVVALASNPDIEANLQYCDHNKEFLFESDGGYVSEGFTDEMLEEAYIEAQNNKEVMRVESLFRDVFDGSKREEFEELRANNGFITVAELKKLAI